MYFPYLIKICYYFHYVILDCDLVYVPILGQFVWVNHAHQKIQNRNIEEK